MSSYQIRYDDVNKSFNSEFPIYLQNLVTPSEFQELLSRSNVICDQYFGSMRRQNLWFIVIIVLGSLLFSALYPIIMISMNPENGGFIVFTIIAPLAFSIVVFGSTFYLIYIRRKNTKMGINELSRFLEEQNNSKFLSRGIQFLARMDLAPNPYINGMYANRYSMARPIIEVNIAPNTTTNNNNNNFNQFNNNNTGGFMNNPYGGQYNAGYDPYSQTQPQYPNTQSISDQTTLLH
eukprot:gb/GECH01012194.1/.p1 GENE.gb/GECH01012194.1/~~gb/GECH01012194.1/.p1  ORF type:complete len:235 (+),score=50.66 gb/GECH01012194.1/:1-705(+)